MTDQVARSQSGRIVSHTSARGTLTYASKFGHDTTNRRYDTIGHDGKISLRHCGKLLHLGIGRSHARTEIICLVHNNDATVIAQHTGEILAEFTLDPAHDYQRKNG